MPLEMRKWLSLSACVIVIDQATKALLSQHFRLGESFLAHADGWQRWFFIALALAVSTWIVVELKRHASGFLMPMGLSLVLGGALGNVIDRLTYGAVVDFLSFHAAGYFWPAFNVADSAITTGVTLLLWQQFRQGKTS